MNYHRSIFIRENINSYNNKKRKTRIIRKRINLERNSEALKFTSEHPHSTLAIDILAGYML